MRSTRTTLTLTSLFVSAPLSLVLLGGTALAAPGHGQSGTAPAVAASSTQEETGPGTSKQHDSKHDSTPVAPASSGGTSAQAASPQPLSRADQNSGGANAGGTHAGCGAYCSTTDGTASANGNGSGTSSKPCAGCVGKADNKDPRGQAPSGADHNNGYECDGNSGVGRGNPAHSGCAAAAPVAVPVPSAPARPAHPTRPTGTPTVPATPPTVPTVVAPPVKPAGVPTVVAPTVPARPAPVDAPVAAAPSSAPKGAPASGPAGAPAVVPAHAPSGVPSVSAAQPGTAPAAPVCPSGPPVAGMVAGCPVPTAAAPTTSGGGGTGVAGGAGSGTVTTPVVHARSVGAPALVPAPAGGALPFTGGAEEGTLLVLGGALVLAGGLLLTAGTRTLRS